MRLHSGKGERGDDYKLAVSWLSASLNIGRGASRTTVCTRTEPLECDIEWQTVQLTCVQLTSYTIYCTWMTWMTQRLDDTYHPGQTTSRETNLIYVLALVSWGMLAQETCSPAARLLRGLVVRPLARSLARLAWASSSRAEHGGLVNNSNGTYVVRHIVHIPSSSQNSLRTPTGTINRSLGSYAALILSRRG